MSLFLMAAAVAYVIGPQDPAGDPKANTPASIAGIIFIYCRQHPTCGKAAS